jgi:uncharacterized membrane protein SpoIIM required for sporulation
MILDLDRFLNEGRPHWKALEELLNHLEHGRQLDLENARRLHRLYERAAADLTRVGTFAAEPETRRYLETLVGRAYAEIHQAASRGPRFRPLHWLWETFPQTFRRHTGAFWLAVVITLAGAVFGGVATVIDPESRHVTMPFGHDQMRPSERVRKEEQFQNRTGRDHVSAGPGHASFSSHLIANNTRVSILTLSLGMTCGLGTIVLLFYNGIGLGAIGVDYVLDGQGRFLAGWLLPHGSTEIPAILIAGQAGLLLGHTLLGRGSSQSLQVRLRQVAPDLVTLFGGVAILLFYAGIIESFLSQYHEPVIPYSLKIAFGLAELSALICYLAFAGRSSPTTPVSAQPTAPAAPDPRRRP